MTIDPSASRLEYKARVQILACVLLFVFLFLHSPFIIYEDAFITFRYADNLIGGHGLAFNAGDSPNEGFSNLLWLLILASAKAIGVDYLVASRYLGLLFSVATIIGIYMLGRRVSSRFAWLPTALLATHPVFIHNSGIGMETPLFCFLIVSSILVLPGWGPPTPQRFKATAANLVMAFVVLLLSLTRPEGVVFPLAFLFCLTIRGLVRHDVDRIDFLWVPLWLAVMILFELWRLSYFGALLPNTYCCKVANGFPSFGDRLQSGLDYVVRFFTWHPMLLLLIPVIILAPMIRRRFDVLFVVSVCTGAYILFIIDAGGDDPGFFFFRFFANILPLMLFSVIIIPAYFSKTQPSRGTIVAMLLLIGSQLYVDDSLVRAGHRPFPSQLARSVWASIHDPRTLFSKVRYSLWHFRLNQHNSIEYRTALWIKARYPVSTVLAGEQAGQIPYYTRMKFIDLWGLVNPEICEVRREPEKVLKILTRSPPDLIVTSGPHRLAGMADFLKQQNMGLRWIVQDRKLIQSTGWEADRMFVFERGYALDLATELVTIEIDGMVVQIEAANVLFTDGERFLSGISEGD